MVSKQDEASSWYDDSRRDDGVAVEMVEKVVEARIRALAQAVHLLKEATEALEQLAPFEGDPIYNRQVIAVREAGRSLTNDAEYRIRGCSPEYVRNLAAGPLGWQVKALGEDFPDI